MNIFEASLTDKEKIDLDLFRVNKQKVINIAEQFKEFYNCRIEKKENKNYYNFSLHNPEWRNGYIRFDFIATNEKSYVLGYGFRPQNLPSEYLHGIIKNTACGDTAISICELNDLTMINKFADHLGFVKK